MLQRLLNNEVFTAAIMLESVKCLEPIRHFKVICVSLFEADISKFSMTSNMISLSSKLLLKVRLHIVVYEWIALIFAKLLSVCKAPRGTCMFTPPPLVLISSQPLGVII